MEDLSLTPLGIAADKGHVELESILRAAVERGASDIHLKADKPPVMRYDGVLMDMEGFGPFDSLMLEDVLATVGALTPRRVAAFQDSGELDTAYQIPGLPRFRVNAFRQRGDISFAFRVIPRDVPDFASLHLPRGVERLSEEHRAVLLECYYRGRPVAEAAERLGIPEGTVKSRTHYALRALRLALEEMGVGA